MCRGVGILLNLAELARDDPEVKRHFEEILARTLDTAEDVKQKLVTADLVEEALRGVESAESGAGGVPAKAMPKRKARSSEPPLAADHPTAPTHPNAPSGSHEPATEAAVYSDGGGSGRPAGHRQGSAGARRTAGGDGDEEAPGRCPAPKRKSSGDGAWKALLRQGGAQVRGASPRHAGASAKKVARKTPGAEERREHLYLRAKREREVSFSSVSDISSMESGSDDWGVCVAPGRTPRGPADAGSDTGAQASTWPRAGGAAHADVGHADDVHSDSGAQASTWPCTRGAAAADDSRADERPEPAMPTAQAAAKVVSGGAEHPAAPRSPDLRTPSGSAEAKAPPVGQAGSADARANLGAPAAQVFNLLAGRACRVTLLADFLSRGGIWKAGVEYDAADVWQGRARLLARRGNPLCWIPAGRMCSDDNDKRRVTDMVASEAGTPLGVSLERRRLFDRAQQALRDFLRARFPIDRGADMRTQQEAKAAQTSRESSFPGKRSGKAKPKEPPPPSGAEEGAPRPSAASGPGGVGEGNHERDTLKAAPAASATATQTSETHAPDPLGGEPWEHEPVCARQVCAKLSRVGLQGMVTRNANQWGTGGTSAMMTAPAPVCSVTCWNMMRSRVRRRAAYLATYELGFSLWELGLTFIPTDAALNQRAGTLRYALRPSRVEGYQAEFLSVGARVAKLRLRRIITGSRTRQRHLGVLPGHGGTDPQAQEEIR